MTLYEIDRRLTEFPYEIDEETGEILNVDDLDALEMEREEKLEAVACYIKNQRAEAKMIDDEMKALKDRRDRKNNRADSLERYLAKSLNGERFETAKCACTWRRSERVIVVDPAILPEDYVVVKTDMKPDKTAIKKAIKAGEEVPGAFLDSVNNMTVR